MVICLFAGVEFNIGAISPESNRNILLFSANADIKEITVRDQATESVISEIRRQNGNVELQVNSEGGVCMVTKIAEGLRVREFGVMDEADNGQDPDAEVVVEIPQQGAPTPEDAMGQPAILGGAATRQPVGHTPTMVDGVAKIEKKEDIDMAKVVLRLAPSMSAFVQESKIVREKVDELNRRMVAVAQLRREIDGLMKDIQTGHPNIVKIENGIVELRKKPYVNDVFVSDGFLVVETNDLETENPINGSRRSIGKMQIKLSIAPLITTSTNGSDGFLVIHNTTRRWQPTRSSHYDCGHVLNGHPCLGEYWEEIHDAIERSDVERLVETTIRFIKNPNINDSWGRSILNFPSVGKRAPEVVNPVGLMAGIATVASASSAATPVGAQ